MARTGVRQERIELDDQVAHRGVPLGGETRIGHDRVHDAVGCRAHQRFGGSGLLLKGQARFAGRRAG